MIKVNSNFRQAIANPHKEKIVNNNNDNNNQILALLDELKSIIKT